jgi:inhibitor of cysteine peptidase
MKKYSRKMLLGLCLLAGVMLANVTFATSAKQGEGMQMQAQLVKRSQRKKVTVTLVENPSTGYRWYLARYPEQWLKPTGHKYIPTKSQLVGAPGKVVWTFEIKKSAFHVPRALSLAFVSLRGFQTDTASLRTVMLLTTNDAK